jgi:hypothetical protein
MARHSVLLAAFLMEPDCPSGTARTEILDLHPLWNQHNPFVSVSSVRSFARARIFVRPPVLAHAAGGRPAEDPVWVVQDKFPRDLLALWALSAFVLSTLWYWLSEARLTRYLARPPPPQVDETDGFMPARRKGRLGVGNARAFVSF